MPPTFTGVAGIRIPVGSPRGGEMSRTRPRRTSRGRTAAQSHVRGSQRSQERTNRANVLCYFLLSRSSRRGSGCLPKGQRLQLFLALWLDTASISIDHCVFLTVQSRVMVSDTHQNLERKSVFGRKSESLILNHLSTR